MVKAVHLIRHAESTVNAHRAITREDPMHLDARLSALGRRQVIAARAGFARLRLDLVVASPLTRSLETALGLFGDRSVPIVVEALMRERAGWSCDVGRPPSELAVDFPELDFDHLDEVWWYADGADGNGIAREPDDHLQHRRTAFLRWLCERPQAIIAVVGHSMFFSGWLGRFIGHLEKVTVEVDSEGRLTGMPASGGSEP